MLFFYLYNSSPVEQFAILPLIPLFFKSFLLSFNNVFTTSIFLFTLSSMHLITKTTKLYFYFFLSGLFLFLYSGNDCLHSYRFSVVYDVLSSLNLFLIFFEDPRQRAEYERLIRAHILADQELAEQEKIKRANLASASAHQKSEYEKVIQELADGLNNLTPEDRKKWLEEHERNLNLKRDLERFKNPRDQDKKDD